MTSPPIKYHPSPKMKPISSLPACSNHIQAKLLPTRITLVMLAVMTQDVQNWGCGLGEQPVSASSHL